MITSTPVSRLDAQFVVVLRRPLADPLKDQLREIPGVAVWNQRNGLTLPWNAGELVFSMLLAAGATRADMIVRVEGERTLPQPFEAALQAAAELRPTTWRDALPFQREAIERAYGLGGATLQAPTGSGKTWMATIWALLEPGPLIVVTPAKARWQWAEAIEALTWLDACELKPESGLRAADEDLAAYLARRVDLGSRFVVVMGWSAVREHGIAVIDQLLAARPLGATETLTLVFDEVQYARNPKRVSHKAVLDEAGQLKWSRTKHAHRSASAYDMALRAQRRLGATATPVANSLIDIWGESTLIEPNGWGPTVGRWKRRHLRMVKDPESGKLKVGGLERIDELNQRRDVTRIVVPFEVVKAQMPAKTRRVVRLHADDLLRDVDPELLAEIAAVQRTLRTDRASPSLMRELRMAEASWRKRPWLLRRIEQHMGLTPGDAPLGDGKIIVLGGRKKEIDVVGAQARERLGSAATIWAAHGETSFAERKAIQKAFWDHPGPCALIGTWDAWGDALNLQRADALIFSRLPDTPEKIIQGEGRVNRIGQLRPVLIEYPQAVGTYDDRLAEILFPKFEAVDKAADGGSLIGFDRALKGLDDKNMIADFLAWSARLVGDPGGPDEDGLDP